jgi:hypothetical protein
MKLHRAFFTCAVVAAGLAGWEGALAQVSNTALVPVAGTVTGSPESVSFSGQAKVNSRLAPDPVFNTPKLVLTVDLTGVSGVGSSSGAKYVISGPEIVQRGVAASHAVEIVFPFVKSGMSLSAARSGVASFALNFDVNTGTVTGATGSVSSPSYPR